MTKLNSSSINIQKKICCNKIISGRNFLFLTSHLDGYFNYILYYNFGVPPELAVVAAPLFRNAIMAHYSGDEKIVPAERKKIDALKQIAPPPLDFLTYTLNSLWTDLDPKDNKTHIKLK